MNKLSLLSWFLVVIATAIYFAMASSIIDQGMKWTLFGVHLFASCAGFAVAMWGVATKHWICVLPLIVCGYFVYIQLLS